MSSYDFSGIEREAGRWWPTLGSALFALGALVALAATVAVGAWVWVVVGYSRALSG